MTVVQALLLGLCGFIVNSPLIGGRFMVMLTRPLPIAFIIGLIMGDMKDAMIIGSVIQAAYIGIVFVGGFSSMPQITISQWIAIPLAIQQGQDAEFALTICLAFSTVEQFVRTTFNSFKLINMQWGDSLIAKGKLRAGYWAYYSSLMWEFIKFMVIVPVACLAGSQVITGIIDALPTVIVEILTVFVGFCPLVGFGMLLLGMITRKSDFLFFLLGFTLFASCGLSIITITVIALAIAYLLMLSKGSAGTSSPDKAEPAAQDSAAAALAAFSDDDE